MTLDTETAEALHASLQRIKDTIHRHCQTIAEETARTTARNADRVKAARLAITGQIRDFQHFSARFGAAYATNMQATKTKGGVRQIAPQDWQQINTEVGKMRSWTGQWTDLQALIDTLMASGRTPLFVDPAQIPDLLARQMAQADAQHAAIRKILNPLEQSEAALAHGCFPDIGLPHSIFLAHLQAARRVLAAQGKTSTARFLDVGCGGGLKVLAAADFCAEADGLEYDAGYVQAAETLFSLSALDTCRVIHGDALTFERYDDYDVVYFYRPVRDHEQLCELERRIVSSVRPGTILIAPYDSFAMRLDGLDCVGIERFLYLAQTDTETAEQVVEQAEHFGASMRHHVTTPRSVFDPILSVATERGYY